MRKEMRELLGRLPKKGPPEEKAFERGLLKEGAEEGFLNGGLQRGQL